LTHSAQHGLTTAGSSSKEESTKLPSESSISSQAPALRSLLKGPILIAIINYGLLALLDSFFLVLQPLMYSSPISILDSTSSIRNGTIRDTNTTMLTNTSLPRPGYGLGLTPHTIGLIMATYGIINVLVQTLLFPVFQKWLGTRRLYIVAMATYAPCFGLFGVMAVVEYWRRVKGGTIIEGGLGSIGVEVVLLLVIQLALYYMATMAYGESLPASKSFSTITSCCFNRLYIHPYHHPYSLSQSPRYDERSCANHCITCKSSGTCIYLGVIYNQCSNGEPWKLARLLDCWCCRDSCRWYGSYLAER